MKTVVIVLPDFQTIGAQRVAIDFGKKFLDFGYHVHWYIGNDHCQPFEINAENITYFNSKLFAKIRFVRIFEQFFRLSFQCRNLHNSTVLSVTPLLNRFLCIFKMLRILNCKLVIEDHAYPPRSYADEFPNFLVRIFYKHTEWLYTFANVMRVLSNDSYDYYKRSLRTLDVRVFPNLMDFNRLERLSCFRNQVSSYDIVFVGRFESQKNVLYLIETLGDYIQMNGVTMLIIGYGSLIDKIKELVERRRLTDLIKIQQTDNLNYSYISNAKIFPLVSLWEGFPLVLIEAMYLGAAVVSVDCKTGPRTLIGDGSERGWLVPENDPIKFVSAIDEALNSSKLRLEKIESAKSYVLNNLNVDEKFDSYIKAFFD